MLKKFQMISWLSVLFALLMIFLPSTYAADQSIPAKAPEATTAPELAPVLVLCNSHLGWSCWRQLGRFAGAVSYEEFLAAAKGVIFDKEGNPVGQGEIKNWNKHPYTKLWVLAPPVVVASVKGSIAPNGIEFTPTAKGSTMQFANFVRTPPAPAPQPVVTAKPVDPTEVAASLPLHQRFSAGERLMLSVLLLILFVPLLLWNLNLRRKLKRVSSRNFEGKTPPLKPEFRPHHDDEKRPQADDVTQFGPLPKGTPV